MVLRSSKRPSVASALGPGLLGTRAQSDWNSWPAVTGQRWSAQLCWSLGDSSLSRPAAGREPHVGSGLSGKRHGWVPFIVVRHRPARAPLGQGCASEVSLTALSHRGVGYCKDPLSMSFLQRPFRSSVPACHVNGDGPLSGPLGLSWPSIAVCTHPPGNP